VKSPLRACIDIKPPLQYARARKGFERFRRKTAHSITICRKNGHIYLRNVSSG
jgi:hypothetical protein